MESLPSRSTEQLESRYSITHIFCLLVSEGFLRDTDQQTFPLKEERVVDLTIVGEVD